MLKKTSKIFSKKFNGLTSNYGVINKKEPKSFFFNFKGKVVCVDDNDNKLLSIEKTIWKNLTNKISDSIKKNYNNFFYDKHIIINLNLSNKIKLDDKSLIEIEVTIKPRVRLPLNQLEVQNLTHEINEELYNVIVSNLIYFKILENGD